MPVYNAQSWLIEQVITFLEILPDFTPQFDLMIVDDGSTDQTTEIAQDLARCYPQVHVTRHPMRHGQSAAVELGLRNTSGEIVIIQDQRSPVSPSQLRYLWRMRMNQRLVMASPDTHSAAETAEIMQRLEKWAAALSSNDLTTAWRDGTQLIRRSTIQQMGTYPEPETCLSVDRDVRSDPIQHDSDPCGNPKFLRRLRDCIHAD